MTYSLAKSEHAAASFPSARPYCILAVVMLALTALPCRSVIAQTEILTNGSFETRTFAGWTLENRPLGERYDPDFPETGTFVIDDNADAITPLSGLPTLGPAAGTFYALSDMTAQGTHTLSQSFTVPLGANSVVLSYDMYVYDFFGAGAAINAMGLDHTTGGTNQPNQHARVDLLSVGAGAFDTDAISVLQNLYIGADLEASQNPPEAPVYRNYSFDLTSVALPGQTYQLRFGAVDNQFVIQQAVDNVSVQVVVVPESGTFALATLGLLPALAVARRRARLIRR